MAKRVYRTGKVDVEMTGMLAGELDRALRAALGDEVLDTVDREMTEIRDRAAATWPVKSGRSRDALYAAIRARDDGFVIEGTVLGIDYSRYIVSKREGKNLTLTRPRSVTVELRRDIVKQKRQVAAKVKDALIRRLRQEVASG